LLDDLEDYVDIVEIGTPFMMQYGMASVQAIKQKLLLRQEKILFFSLSGATCN